MHHALTICLSLLQPEHDKTAIGRLALWWMNTDLQKDTRKTMQYLKCDTIETNIV